MHSANRRAGQPRPPIAMFGRRLDRAAPPRYLLPLLRPEPLLRLPLLLRLERPFEPPLRFEPELRPELRLLLPLELPPLRLRLPEPPRPEDDSFFSLPGQSMFTQMRHGPRAVSTTTMGAPQCSQTSPVAVSLPRAGSG